MNINYRVYIYIMCTQKRKEKKKKNETLLDQQNMCVQLCA